MVYISQNIEIDRNLPEDEYKREYDRIYREQNKERIKAYNKARYEAQLRRVRGFKPQYIEYKGGKCILCGTRYDGRNSAMFDFHHLDPSQKEHNFGGMNRVLKSAKVELDKCVLVCANCHRLLHAGVIELEKQIEAI